MSKLVNWGHWIVGIAFASSGLGFLFGRGVSDAVRAVRGQQPFYSFDMVVLTCVPILLCAWGILNWRDWGHKLAILLSLLGLVSLVLALSALGIHELGSSFVSSAVSAIAILIWLLLPAVRLEYRKRNQVA
jgi:peptidoglycan/LPS O-acetylase OafA/YrhL